MIPGWVKFDPIRLNTGVGSGWYQIRDNNGIWTNRFVSHMFPDFFEIFDMLTSYGGNHRHSSSIRVTSNYGASSSRTRIFDDRFHPRIRVNELQIDVFNDSNFENFMRQSLDVEIRSGLYRCTSRGEGTFIWNMRLLARDFGINDIVFYGGSEPMEGTALFDLNGGSFDTTGRFVRIIPPRPPGDGLPVGCDPNFPCPPHDPSRPAYRICTCISGGFGYVFEGNRFTSIPPSSPIEHPVDNVVIIKPVQTGPNTGTLTVYATEAMYRELVSR